MYEPKKKSSANDPDRSSINYAGANAPEKKSSKKEKSSASVKTLSRICAALAFIAILAIGFGVFSSMMSAQKYAVVDSETDDVVVAAVDIPEGHVIAANEVKVVSVAKNLIPSGAYSSTSDVVGRVAGHYLAANTVVSEKSLSGDKGATLADRLGEGHVGITIAVTQESGVAGLIHQGDHVTILASNGDSSGDASASPIARHVKVLAEDSMLDEYSNLYTSLTLEVTEAEASSIATAKSSGSVTCVLEATSE